MVKEKNLKIHKQLLNMYQISIILTCTVNINPNKSWLLQINPLERKQIYIKSVLQWLEFSNFNIILIDNSGETFNELNHEKEIYKNRFEVITFIESQEKEAGYLLNNISKGASEMFAINYAFCHSKLIHNSIFIIKVTGRYFIEELEEYLRFFDLNNYDCLTQLNRNRCEMVGSHYKNFTHIFNKYLIYDNYQYEGHVENIWNYRTSKYDNILVCKEFSINETTRGCLQTSFSNI